MATTKTAESAGQTRHAAVIAVAALVVIAVVSLIIAFHYPKASDATSVLGVIVPAMAAIVGAAAGSVGGLAAGSAKRNAMTAQLTQAHDAIQHAHDELDQVGTAVDGVLPVLRQQLSSPVGDARLLLNAGAAGGSEPGLDLSQLDTLTTSLGRARAVLETAKPALE